MQEPYTLSGQKDISAEPLADIRHVSVNKDLSREERIAEFVRQIKDPYCFKCGKFTVRASFAQGGATLEECLQGVLRKIFLNWGLLFPAGSVIIFLGKGIE